MALDSLINVSTYLEGTRKFESGEEKFKIYLIREKRSKEMTSFEGLMEDDLGLSIISGTCGIKTGSEIILNQKYSAQAILNGAPGEEIVYSGKSRPFDRYEGEYRPKDSGIPTGTFSMEVPWTTTVRTL